MRNSPDLPEALSLKALPTATQETLQDSVPVLHICLRKSIVGHASWDDVLFPWQAATTEKRKEEEPQDPSGSPPPPLESIINRR
ncbi:hypothetical protein Pmani_020901 [Petrolisthes manimaculis]|uniref:Uncharacterized protein n=1 Tax=Petrolisthes manimaculis TaxID=1843537 RepID=A0AAE1PHR7_9EUCA|nr:hypothetical protein Pmani_020901 [Petrolisthes manimaculis]